MTNKKYQYWLLKSEPTTFSIQDLENSPNQTTCWDGVRNYQARNYLRDTMTMGDSVLFYHSNAQPPSIVGIAKIVKAGYPDYSAFDPRDPHFDPNSKQSNPTWYMVDIKHVKTFPKPISLDLLRITRGLEKMVLLQKGSRLSVQPVTQTEWKIILQLRES